MTDVLDDKTVASGAAAPGFSTGGSWVGRLQQGDDGQAAQIWHHYHVKLIAMAQQRLQMSPQQLADGQDVVVSAFASFFRAVQEERIDDNINENELWRLLVTLTARKAIKVMRYEGRQLRDSHLLDHVQDLDQIIGDEPTPEFAAAVAEQYRWLSEQMVDEPMRRLLQLKMEGYRNAEIAQQIDCSVRTVKRRLTLIRSLLAHEIDKQP